MTESESTTGGTPLTNDAIMALLQTQRGTSKPKTDTRDITTWFQLNHVSLDTGCENPDCIDPRSEDDRGRDIVSKVNGQHMCRYCFLNNWLKEPLNNVSD